MSLLDEDEDPCAGCVFMRERSEVCHKAGAEAKLRRYLIVKTAGFTFR